jgi:hypothetical protein
MGKLVIANHYIWMDDDTYCISQLRSVRTLILHNLLSKNDDSRWDLDDRGSIALLPSLQKLELVGFIILRFLRHLNLPSLQEVQVEEDRPGRHSLAEIPSSTLRLVTSIVIVAFSSSISSWSHELHEIINIRSAPPVKTLTLTSWIHRELSGEERHTELGCRLQLWIT